MNARELFDALAGLPGVRAARVEGRDILTSRVLGGVEVALARTTDERELRKVWRGRADGGPVPLLLVADDIGAEGTLRALGPLDAGGPMRVVAAEDLLRVLERLPSRSSLIAVRELAEELARLDRTGLRGDDPLPRRAPAAARRWA